MINTVARDEKDQPDDIKQPDRPKLLQILGPGLITGASDDDPSGIATYSQSGAQFGFAMCWVMLFTFPLMAAIQEISARIGRVTGLGIAGNLRKHYPAWLLNGVVGLLVAANTINLGADLGAMAAALKLLIGGPQLVYVAAFAVISALLEIFVRYSRYVSVLKWLTLSLFAYVATVFVVGVPWGRAVAGTLLPHLQLSGDYLTVVVAVLGTTISPYLFFWQASQEIEEEKEKGHRTQASRRGAPARDLNNRVIDVGLGTFFSNFIMYFIILTAAATLHRHGVTTQVESSRDAVRVLEPFAGKFAALLYAAGLISVGFLAIPTLAGSSAYAFAETFAWRQGLGQKLHRARAFYGTLACSIVFGIALCFTHVKATDALFLTAVINGMLAPFLLIAIVWVASDNAIMRGQPSSWLARIVVIITTLGMFAAAIGIFL